MRLETDSPTSGDAGQSPNSGSIFKRAGVSDEFLKQAGCRHIGDAECAREYGFKAAGIVIPFRENGADICFDGAKQFARVRLYESRGDQKYSQRAGSSVHVYVPPGFSGLPKKSTLFLVEGEFKSLSLMEAGFAALGLCGISGACQARDGSPELNVELVALMQLHQPARLVFLGDGDVVLNAQFAAEAAKLFKLVRSDRRLQFVDSCLVGKPPVDGPKGVDDCRLSFGLGFNQWFERLSQSAYVVPAKATAFDTFVDLLKREAEQVRKILTIKGQDARHARNKLLRSAAAFWNDPSAPVELVPLLCSVLCVNKTELSGYIKGFTAEAKAKASESAKQKQAPDEHAGLEPWPEPVDGALVAEEIYGELKKFTSLPPQADVLLTMWIIHTYVFELCSFTPYLHITSPEGGCGKSTLAELLQHLCANATTPGGMSAAAMFRRIDRKRPVLLLDEWDTLSEENRQAALNILNTGFKYNGVYTICVGDEHEDRDFKTFCPKAIFGLAAAKLQDTTRSRSFTFSLQKKLPHEKLEKLTRKFDAADLRRKCLRWAKDNTEKLAASEPVVPSGLGARQEDISEPLLAVADACGGRWPEAIRSCVVHFFTTANRAASGLGVELLKDSRFLFASQGNQIGSADLAERLNALADRPWGSWNEGRGITMRNIAERLHQFGISSRDLWLQHRCVKGYHQDDFTDAFIRYLNEISDASRENASEPVNTEHNAFFAPASASEPRGPKSDLIANNDEGSRGLAVENATETDAETMRI